MSIEIVIFQCECCDLYAAYHLCKLANKKGMPDVYNSNLAEPNLDCNKLQLKFHLFKIQR